MEIKEMREKLRDVVETVPRSNDAVVALYNEKFPEDAQEVTEIVKPVKSDNIYTYIGAGHEPPSVIKFMGIQSFIRGKATPVTNPTVLAKIKNHPCFVNGEVEADELVERDSKEDKRVEEQRQKDMQTQQIARRLMQ